MFPLLIVLTCALANEALQFNNPNMDMIHADSKDQNILLGEDGGDFDSLKPEEKKRRLGLIVDKIDTDTNSHLSEEEIRKWVKQNNFRQLSNELSKMWAHYKPVEGKLSWEKFRETYNELIEQEKKEPELFKAQSTKRMIDKDRRRWQVADQDGDGMLNKEEFVHFSYPQNSDYTRDVFIEDVIKDMDKDDDGLVSEKEFIDDIYARSGTESSEEDSGFAKEERKQFRRSYDKNKDGKLDKNEVLDWVLPSRDHDDAEIRQLFKSNDADQDGVLSKDEILDKYENFVSSYVIDAGNDLTRHDEF